MWRSFRCDIEHQRVNYKVTDILLMIRADGISTRMVCR
jgi:hypothetical protein